MTNPEYIKRYQKKWLSLNRHKARKYERSQYYKVKTKVFNHYGNICSYCGLNDTDILVVDHINENGANERAKYKSQYTRYNLIIKKGFPKKEYQLLCRNCN